MEVWDFKTGVEIYEYDLLQLTAYCHLINQSNNINEYPLEFDEKTHVYIYNGNIIPSVTQVLKDLKPKIFKKEEMQLAAKRGRYVHKSIEYINSGILDYDKVKEKYKGYIDAYLNFKQKYLIDFKLNELICEKMIYSPLCLAGTIDLYVDDGNKNYKAYNVYLMQNGNFSLKVRYNDHNQVSLTKNFRIFHGALNYLLLQMNMLKLHK